MLVDLQRRQGQALRRSGHGGSGENKVTIRPLRLQEDYSPEERKFGVFFLPLPPLEIDKHLRVLKGPLGAPSTPEPWQAQSILATIPRPPTASSECILATGPTVSSWLSTVLLAIEGAN